LQTKVKCSGLNCLGERMIPKPPIESAPLDTWETDFDPGSSVVFQRNLGVDVLGVTLSGSIRITPDETAGKGSEAREWNAFVAPGAGVTLSATSAARVLLAIVTSHESVSPIPSLGTWDARPSPIAVVDLAAQPDLAWAKGACHARIAFGGETSRYASLAVLAMSPGVPVPLHTHELEWEHMAILQGDGDFVQGAEQPAHVVSGAVVSVRPKTPHEWRARGNTPFLGIQFYTPPGPEQRFKKLAAP